MHSQSLFPNVSGYKVETLVVDVDKSQNQDENASGVDLFFKCLAEIDANHLTDYRWARSAVRKLLSHQHQHHHCFTSVERWESFFTDDNLFLCNGAY